MEMKGNALGLLFSIGLISCAPEAAKSDKDPNQANDPSSDKPFYLQESTRAVALHETFEASEVPDSELYWRGLANVAETYHFNWEVWDDFFSKPTLSYAESTYQEFLTYQRGQDFESDFLESFGCSVHGSETFNAVKDDAVSNTIVYKFTSTYDTCVSGNKSDFDLLVRSGSLYVELEFIENDSDEVIETSWRIEMDGVFDRVNADINYVVDTGISGIAQEFDMQFDGHHSNSSAERAVTMTGDLSLNVLGQLEDGTEFGLKGDLTTSMPNPFTLPDASGYNGLDMIQNIVTGGHTLQIMIVDGNTSRTFNGEAI